MRRILTVLAACFAAVVAATAVSAQTDRDEDLPTLPSMPLMQDCENLRQAYERVSSRLRAQAQDSQLASKYDEADTVAARGRWLYDECLRKTFSGGGGMGG